MREGAEEASRPNIGRKKKTSDRESVPDTSVVVDGQIATENQNNTDRVNSRPPSLTAKIQTADQAPNGESLSVKSPHPNYVRKGPIITNEMFSKWSPDMLEASGTNARPVRSTRNKNPKYVEAIAA